MFHSVCALNYMLFSIINPSLNYIYRLDIHVCRRMQCYQFVHVLFMLLYSVTLYTKNVKNLGSICLFFNVCLMVIIIHLCYRINIYVGLQRSLCDILQNTIWLKRGLCLLTKSACALLIINCSMYNVHVIVVYYHAYDFPR